MKLAFAPGNDVPLKAHPEYEDCAHIAQQQHLPWREVHQQAMASWQRQSAVSQPQIATTMTYQES
jgi:hypothetical protein